jgi:AbrB family looped-hinge helix DNA binding protein
MTAAYRREVVSTDPASRIASRASGFALYCASDKVKDMPKVSSKNQVTIPVEAMRAAGLRAGDEITVRPVGEGEIVIATRGSRVRRNAGIAKGIYNDGELDRLRDEWKR